MNIRRFFFLLVFGLFVQISNAQISFIGFEQEQCGLITGHEYTYQNIQLMCGSHGHGYRVFFEGEMIFEKCTNYEPRSIVELMFVSETTGFIVEQNINGHTVYKTVTTTST